MAILLTEAELLVELSTCSFGQSTDRALPEDPISPSKVLGLQVGHLQARSVYVGVGNSLTGPHMKSDLLKH